MQLREIIVRYLIAEIRNLTKDKFFDAGEIPNDMPMKDVIVNLILPEMKFLNKEHFLNQKQ